MNSQPIESEDVVQLVQTIFQSMLHLPCETAEPQAASVNKHLDEDRFIGCVQIHGDWSGAIALNASMDLGRKAASSMLMIPDEEVTVDDVRDTIAELSNMIGGSIKGIIPGKSMLSLPSVASGHDLDFKLMHVTHSQTVPMQSNGIQFLISILHLDCPSASNLERCR